MHKLLEMPRFAYRAKDTAAKVVEGMIEAESETAAIARLGASGVYPLRIEETSEQAATPTRTLSRQRVPSRTLAYMNRQLADLLGGGLSLFNALSLLSQQTEHRYLRSVISEVADVVRDGQAFSSALSKHPEIFSTLYISMIKAGEVGGGLDSVLVRLADLAENETELKSRVTSALVYPLVVLVVGLLTIMVLLTYVVPKLTVLFEETGQLLPLPTRILLAISQACTQGWWVGILVIGGSIWGFQTLRMSPVGRAALDRLLLRVPLVGDLVRKLETSRLTKNLGVMVGQGVPLLQSLEVASSTISNTVLRQAIQQVREDVRQGENLASAMKVGDHFPVFVSNMVAVGEESGTLDTALGKVGAAYERETDRTLRILTTVLEPLLIVCVGLVVMFIVISVLLPIFEIGLVVQ